MITSRYITLFLVIVLITGCQIRKTEKYYQKAREKAPFDAIIVPGVPFQDGSWQPVMKLRIYWAKYLWDQKMTNNIIFSGGAVYTPYCESKIMRLYALEMGIPGKNLYIDTLAQHSTENVFYSYQVGVDAGFTKMALATDPFQAKMLKPFIRKMKRKIGAEIDILPAMMDSTVADNMPDFDIPYDEAFEDSNFVNITETQSKWYRFRGTLGLHIEWPE